MSYQELRDRYSPSQLEIIDQYFQTLTGTRKTGRILQSVTLKEMEYWTKFPPEVVVDALQIHIRKHPGKKEAYTRGIMRELARERSGTGGADGQSSPARGGYGQGKYGSRYIDGNSDALPF